VPLRPSCNAWRVRVRALVSCCLPWRCPLPPLGGLGWPSARHAPPLLSSTESRARLQLACLIVEILSQYIDCRALCPWCAQGDGCACWGRWAGRRGEAQLLTGPPFPRCSWVPLAPGVLATPGSRTWHFKAVVCTAGTWRGCGAHACGGPRPPCVCCPHSAKEDTINATNPTQEDIDAADKAQRIVNNDLVRERPDAVPTSCKTSPFNLSLLVVCAFVCLREL
jgi:hypothetical protein